MKKGKVFLLVPCAYFLLITVLVAQKTPSFSIIIDNKKGLDDQNVYKTIRDSTGYFYFFMTNAVQRWDGNILVDIIKPEDHTGLTFNNVRDLHLMGSKNILYINKNYNEEIYLLDVVLKKVKAIKLPEESICFYTPNYLILQEKDGSLYALFDWLNENYHKKYIGTADEIKQVIYKNEELFIQTNFKTYLFENLILKKTIDFNGIIGLAGEQIFGFKKDKIYKIENKELSFHSLVPEATKKTIRPYIVKNNEYQDLIVLYDQGEFILESIILVSQDGNIENYSELVEPLNERCTDVLCGVKGRKWMISTYNGVFIYQYPLPGIEHPLYVTNIPPGDYGYIITGCYKGEDYLLFLDETNKLIRYNTQSQFYDEPFKNYVDNKYYNLNLKSSIPKIDPSIKSYFLANQKIKKLKNGDFITSSYYSYVVDSISYLHRFSHFKETPKTFMTVPFRIEDMEPLNEKEILLVGRFENIAKCAILNVESLDLEYIPLPVKFPTIKTITLDFKTNQYILATAKGIWLMDKNYRVQKLPAASNANFEILMNTGFITTQRWEDKIIFASRNGLFYYSEKDQEIHIINESNGLTHQICYGILVDQSNHLWISTQNGLTVFNTDMEIIKTIHDYDGLGEGNSEFNTESALMDKKGILYFGTINGLIVINPWVVLQTPSDKGFDITETVLYKNSKAKGIYSLEEKDQIVTNNKFDSLVIRVNRPDFFVHSVDNHISDNLKFETISDPEFHWTQNSMHFANLTNSKFELKVRSDADDERLLSFKFERNRSDIIVVFSLLFGIIILSIAISKFTIHRIQKNNLQKLQIEKKLSNMRLSTLQSQMNPHFIFNCLGSIQYFMQTHDLQSAEKYLTEFAKLTRLFLESSKSKTFLVKDEIELLKLYLSMEQNRFSEKFEYEFYIDPDLDMTFEIPPMVLQPFIENSINHGVRHLKNKKGVIQISFEHVNEDILRCCIIDNGIGREASKKLRSSTTHKSRAMEILNEKIELLKNSQGQHFYFTIIDMFDGSHQSLGTKIIVDFH